MEEKSEILEQLDELEKAAAELAHRMHPYMTNTQPAVSTDPPARLEKSPVFERIANATAHLRHLSARLVP